MDFRRNPMVFKVLWNLCEKLGVDLDRPGNQTGSMGYTFSTKVRFRSLPPERVGTRRTRSK